MGAVTRVKSVCQSDPSSESSRAPKSRYLSERRFFDDYARSGPGEGGEVLRGATRARRSWSGTIRLSEPCKGQPVRIRLRRAAETAVRDVFDMPHVQQTRIGDVCRRATLASDPSIRYVWQDVCNRLGHVGSYTRRGEVPSPGHWLPGRRKVQFLHALAHNELLWMLPVYRPSPYGYRSQPLLPFLTKRRGW